MMLVTFNSCIKLGLGLNTRVKDKPFFNEDPKAVNSNTVPIIHLHVDDHASDPINFRRFDGERQAYSMRVNELHSKYENEKKGLTKIISFQLSKLAQLTEVADATSKIVMMLVPKKEIENKK